MTNLVRWPAILFVLSSYLAIFLVSGSAFTITDDTSGGDCSTIGSWDAGTKTWALTTNFTEGITIASDNITLNGEGG
jgi:hypothetical protein